MPVALALDDDDRRRVRVPGFGLVCVATQLAPSEIAALRTQAQDPDVSDEGFRRSWLLAISDVDADTLDAATPVTRHRLSVAVLRALGLEGRWKALYGSAAPVPTRLRSLVEESLEDLAAAPPARETAARDVIKLDEFRRSADLVTGPLRAQLEQFAKRIGELIAPILEAVQRAIRPLTDSVSRAMNNFVRQPAFRQALRIVDEQQRRLGEVSLKPVEALFRSRDLTRARMASAPSAPPTETPTELPDAASLAAFYSEERADPEWSTSQIGWALAKLPLGIGGVLHERFGVSTESGLRWLAERFARRELRARLLRVLAELPLDDALAERFRNGIRDYFDGDYSSADTLLSSALDGLLFTIAVDRGLLTPAGRIVRPGKNGRKVKTGSDGALLHALGFNQSEKDFLVRLSVGQAGNRPRHGLTSDLGSQEHASAVLLGLLLVLFHFGRDRLVVTKFLGP